MESSCPPRAPKRGERPLNPRYSGVCGTFGRVGAWDEEHLALHGTQQDSRDNAQTMSDETWGLSAGFSPRSPRWMRASSIPRN